MDLELKTKKKFILSYRNYKIVIEHNLAYADDSTHVTLNRYSTLSARFYKTGL